ncbi:MAG: methyltransferase [Oscillospiraceae bacterium]|nr:methyltransferase [Oscillospiraceae bacterium]
MRVCVSDAHTFGTDSFLLSHFAAPRRHDLACDLCSGCGIIPLLWLRGGGGPRHAYAVDIQEEAWAQMARSAALSGVEERFTPIHADLRIPDKRLPQGQFHLVTCNPPYKAANTGLISRDEAARIARHETLCTLEDVCAAARKLLRFGGRLCISQLPERLVDVLSAMRAADIEPKRIRFVQNRADTAPWLILVEGKRGARPFLKVDPPLILRDGQGASEEMRHIYGLYGHVETIQ